MVAVRSWDVRQIPPHCDTRDSPVVKAATKTLETGNMNFVLIRIPSKPEEELRGILKKPCMHGKQYGNHGILPTTGSSEMFSGLTGTDTHIIPHVNTNSGRSNCDPAGREEHR